jgi:hypothetical protein
MKIIKNNKKSKKNQTDEIYSLITNPHILALYLIYCNAFNVIHLLVSLFIFHSNYIFYQTDKIYYYCFNFHCRN